jgi:hypothetical protein
MLLKQKDRREYMLKYKGKRTECNKRSRHYILIRAVSSGSSLSADVWGQMMYF